MSRRLRDLLFLSFAIFILGVIIAANGKAGGGFFALFHRIPYFDKVGHFLLMGILAFLALNALVPRMKGPSTRSTVIVVLILSLIIGLEEASQHFIESRTCSLADYLFSVAGVITAAMLGRNSFRSKPDG